MVSLTPTKTSSRSFSKYSGAGNDFILIDDRQQTFSPSEVTRLCARSTGIGADGLILLQSSSTADLKMRIFNADGSEAEMCGNGLRCFAAFAHEKGYTFPTLDVEVSGQIYGVKKYDLSTICIQLPPLKTPPVTLKLEGLDFHLLNTGVPHLICFVEDVAQAPMHLAPKLRQSPEPHGANVNFVQVIDAKNLAVRTYERGVEGETLACGTGATASAIAASIQHELSSPITVSVPSGDQLTVGFTWEEESPQEITLTGPVQKIFEGVVQTALNTDWK